MQVCVVSIKLGAANPTPSTVGESSKPRPPGGALGKFPLVTEERSGSADPRCQLCWPLATRQRLREPGGKRTSGARLSGRRSPGAPGAALHSGWSHRPSPGGTLCGRRT